jgi:hypothetical protein
MRLIGLFCLLLALAGISAAQDTSFPVGPQYLLTGSPLFAQPVATPSRSLEAPLPPVPSFPEDSGVINQQPISESEAAQIQIPVDLFSIYYGYPLPSVIILSSDEPPRELPASIVEAGVVRMVDAESLRQQGYGVPLGETSSFWKTHTPHATRVYTNADVERLHGS